VWRIWPSLKKSLKEKKMNLGYMGKILRVDLTNRLWDIDEIDLEIRKKYMGGRGLGIWLLSKEIDPKVDPFHENNALIFMTGPYTGTSVFSAFYNVTTKSPQTGISTGSHAGGNWGPNLKRSGFDAIIIKGKAERPCYLAVDNGHCQILDAGPIWGKTVRNTEAYLKECHPKLAPAVIGPSGENLVTFAAVMNDTHRAAGRCGVGAVMGSKKLKAITVGGDQKIQYFDRKAFTDIAGAGGKRALETAAPFAKYGTPLVFAVFNESGSLPTYNFRAGYFKEADKINGDALKESFFVRNSGCFNCPLKCGNIHSVPDGPFAVSETEGPEYETMMAFGSNCGNADLASIIKASDLCNDLGMDTISAGNTIALVMDLHDKGHLDAKLVDGLDLSWGNGHTILELLKRIAYRKGFGDVMAEGSLKTAQYFGDECEKFALHAKRQEFSGQEVRRSYGMGLSFATSNRGADHLRGCMYVEEIFLKTFDVYSYEDSKVQTLVDKENFLALIDSLVMCKFGQRNGGFTQEVLPNMLHALTGFELSAQELDTIGERIYNTERLFNLKAGMGPDELPQRLFEEDLEDELSGGKRLNRDEFKRAIESYYNKRLWDSSGKPTAQKVKALGLS